MPSASWEDWFPVHCEGWRHTKIRTEVTVLVITKNRISDIIITSGLAAGQRALAARLVALPRRGLLGVHGVDGRSRQSLRLRQHRGESLREVGGVRSYGGGRRTLLLVGQREGVAVAGEDPRSPEVTPDRPHLTGEGPGAVGGLGEGWRSGRGERFGLTGNRRWRRHLGETFT